ncbi:MAG: hypothetical protein GY855_11750 [candidate division Zixibacteria bacterium]|nr:hypothetical protein [candidate division Zixibacteria bacterium]
MKKILLFTLALIFITGIIANANPGDTIWTRTYGGSDSDRAMSVQQTTDGSYIIAGYTESYGMGSKDLYLVKVEGSLTGIETTSRFLYIQSNRKDELLFWRFYLRKLN